MERVGNFLQLESALQSGLFLVFALALLPALVGAVRVRVRRKGTRRPERPRLLASGGLGPSLVPPSRLLPFLGFALATAPSPARAQYTGPAGGTERWVTPPWTRTSGYPPPPRPLVRSWALPDMSGDPGRVSDDRVPEGRDSLVHPAIHGRTLTPRGRLVPLFPRAGQARGHAAQAIRSAEVIQLPALSGDAEHRRRALADSIRRHPSGKETPTGSSSSRPSNAHRCARGRGRGSHTVRDGDTLWSIAQESLGTDDPRFVARYWPKIHRANRDVIGSDPSLIYPGQVLHLPPCEE
jgi:hypothetical protein